MAQRRFVVVLSAFAAVVLFATGVSAQTSAKVQKQAIELYRQGIQFGNDGKLPEAIDAFERAVALFPTFDLAFLKLGFAYEHSDRWPEALACYQQAVTVVPAKKRRPECMAQLGAFYRTMGLLDLATATYREAISLDPKKPFHRGHYEVGLILLEQKRPADAVVEFQTAIKAEPENDDAHLALANAHLALEQWDDARAAVAAVLKRKPEEANVLHAMGLVERRAGNRTEAREYFEKACKLGHRRACRDARDRYRAIQ